MTKDEIIAAVMDGLLGVPDVLVTFIPEHSPAKMAYDFETGKYHLLIPENSTQDLIGRMVASVRCRETQTRTC